MIKKHRKFIKHCDRARNLPIITNEQATSARINSYNAQTRRGYKNDHRPINIMSIMYKMFPKLLHNRRPRISKERRAQAGFRKNYLRQNQRV